MAGIGSGYGPLWKVAGKSSVDTSCGLLFKSKSWILAYEELTVLEFSIEWFAFFMTWLQTLHCVCLFGQRLMTGLHQSGHLSSLLNVS